MFYISVSHSMLLGNIGLSFIKISFINCISFISNPYIAIYIAITIELRFKYWSVFHLIIKFFKMSMHIQVFCVCVSVLTLSYELTKHEKKKHKSFTQEKKMTLFPLECLLQWCPKILNVSQVALHSNGCSDISLSDLEHEVREPKRNFGLTRVQQKVKSSYVEQYFNLIWLL